MESSEEREWRTIPTDLAGWANRAAKVKTERDRLREENARLRRIEEAMEKIANGNHGGHAHSFAREVLEEERLWEREK